MSTLNLILELAGAASILFATYQYGKYFQSRDTARAMTSKRS